MENRISLGETMQQYLTGSQKATAYKIAGYVWFDRQNEARFNEILEPLAYSVKLGLQHQIQTYFTAVEKIYHEDLLLKTSLLVREKLHLDGSVFEHYDDITYVKDLDIILPEKAFDIIDRLFSEGFDAGDFAVAIEYYCYTLALQVGNRWLRLMPLEKK
jgi:hypothetical protein